MKKTTWGWIAAGAAAVVAVVAVVYEETKKPSSTNPPAPATSFTLQPNTVYALKLSCPSINLTTLFPPVPVPPSTAAGILLSGFSVQAQSFSFSPDGHTATLIFLYTGSQPVTVPSIQMSGATGCSTSIAPTVASPGPVHQGGVNPTGLHNVVTPQSVTLQSAGQVKSASAVAGGTLNISAPGNIVSVTNIWGTASSGSSISGATAAVTLTGNQGHLTVMWVAITPNGSMQQQATVQVS